MADELERKAYDAAKAVIQDEGMSFPTLWDGTLYDLERERFEAFLGACKEYSAIDNASLRTQLALKDKALREVEWSGGRCPSCGFKMEEGHEPQCDLAQALSPSLTDAKT